VWSFSTYGPSESDISIVFRSVATDDGCDAFCCCGSGRSLLLVLNQSSRRTLSRTMERRADGGECGGQPTTYRRVEGTFRRFCPGDMCRYTVGPLQYAAPQRSSRQTGKTGQTFVPISTNLRPSNDDEDDGDDSLLRQSHVLIAAA
jgi:hypothetical protein